MPTVAAPVLRSFSESILLAAGVPAHKAAIVAASLVAANLRGVDSHGIQLLTFYVDQLLAGEMDPHAEGRVTSESGSCLLFDGQNGIGQWIAETCCVWYRVVRSQRATPSGVLGSRESGRFARAARIRF